MQIHILAIQVQYTQTCRDLHLAKAFYEIIQNRVRYTMPWELEACPISLELGA